MFRTFLRDPNISPCHGRKKAYKIDRLTFVFHSDSPMVSNQVEFNDLALPTITSAQDQHLISHRTLNRGHLIELDPIDNQISDQARALIESWEAMMSTERNCRSQRTQFVMMNVYSKADYSQPPKRFWRTSWECMTRKLIARSHSMAALPAEHNAYKS